MQRESGEKVGRSGRILLLAILVLAFAFNNADRIALGIVLQSIKADLSLSDTQLGIVTGIAFALFYSTMGIPLAAIADRGKQVRVLSASVAISSLTIGLLGTVTSFAHLLMLRVVAAIGEAGCVPAAHSLVAARFSRAERPRAVGIFMLGGPLGIFAGYLGAGWLNEFFGWRMTFLIIALPGAVIGLIAWLWLKGPSESDAAPEQTTVSADVRHAFRTLPASKTFLHIAISYSLISFFGNGIAQWQPSFFIRSFAMSGGELGTWLALVYGFGSLIGLVSGGEVATRLAPNNERMQLCLVAIATGAFGLLSLGIYVASSAYLALFLIFLSAVGTGVSISPLFATVQTIVPASMRAMAIAILYLMANLIGLGFGPLAAGFLSDQLHPYVGEESLRYALLCLSPGYFWAAWHVWLAAKSVQFEIPSSEASPDVGVSAQGSI